MDEQFLYISKDILLTVGKYCDNEFYYFNMSDKTTKQFRIDYNKGFKTIDNARLYAEKHIINFLKTNLKELLKNE